jgi:hypothetical protein
MQRDIGELIAEVQRCEQSNRRCTAGVLVLSFLLAAMLFMTVATHYPKWLGWCVMGCVALVWIWIGRAGIRSLKVSRGEAAQMLDRAVGAKERAVSFAELQSDGIAKHTVQREVLARQLQALVPDDVTARQIAPYVMSQAERRAIVVGLLCLIALVTALLLRPRSTLDELIATIEEVEAQHPEVPLEVQRALAALIEQASDPQAEPQDVAGAFAAAKKALDSAAEAGRSIDSKGAKTPESALADTQVTQRQQPQEASQREQQSSEKSTDVGSQQQQRKDSQQREPQQQASQQKEPQQKEQGARDPRDKAQQGQQQKEQQQGGSNDTGSDSSSGGKRGGHGEQEGQQDGQDGQQAQSDGQAQQGQQGQQGQQSQQGTQGQQGKEGQRAEQGQGEGGSGDGQGAGTGGSGQGGKSESAESQGQQGPGKQGQGQQGQGEGEGNQGEGQGREGQQATGQQGDEQRPDGQQGKTADGKSGEAGQAQGSSESEGIAKLQDAVAKAEEALKQSGQGDAGDQGTSDKPGAGDDAEQKQNDTQRSGKGDGRGDQSKSTRSDGEAGKREGTQKGDEGTSSSGASSAGAQKGKDQERQPPGEGEGAGAGTRGDDSSRPDPNARAATPGAGTQPSSGGNSPEVDRNAQAREGGFDPNAPEGPGLGGQGQFKDVRIEVNGEKLDERFTGNDLNPEQGETVAKPKTTLEDLTLAKPKSAPHKGEQPIPLEYRDVLK